MRVVRNGVTRIKFHGKKGQGKLFNTILQALNYFCTHTTIHGLRHIVNPELHIIERFLWLVMFVISSTIASNVIYSLALRFQVNPMKGKTKISIQHIYNLSNIYVYIIRIIIFGFKRFSWYQKSIVEKQFLTNFRVLIHCIHLFRMHRRRLISNRCIMGLHIYLFRAWLFVRMIVSTGIEPSNSN